MPLQIAAALGSRSAHHRWLEIGVVALASLGIFLCIATAITFSTVGDRQYLLSQTVREDAVWAAYQIDSEAKKVRLALSGGISAQNTIGMPLISRTAQPLESCVRDGRIVDLSTLERDLSASRRELESRSPRNQHMLLSA